MTPTIGTKFLHKTWTDAAGKPLVYEVTAIRNGAIYIRAEGEKKAKEHTTPDRWHGVCGQVLQ